MKILVTGGAGFIGSHIVDSYVSLGHHVVVVDDLSTGRREFVNKEAVFYQEDIKEKEVIEKILRKEKVEVINHHAAQISVRDSVADPIFDAKTNIIGLLNILETAKETGVKKIIFASSGGVVYGEADQIPTTENYSPIIPLSPYAITKLSSEYYLYIYYKSHGISYIALRYGNVYGPRQNPYGEAGVIAIFALKLIENQTPIINGDGKQTRDYVFVGDVVEANNKALNTKEVGSFNIGTGEETDVVTIYQTLKKILNSSQVAKHGPAKIGEQRRSCLDCEKAKRNLDWVAKKKLNAGLKVTARYFDEYGKNNE